VEKSRLAWRMHADTFVLIVLWARGYSGDKIISAVIKKFRVRFGRAPRA
jgi:hypothetical protein